MLLKKCFNNKSVYSASFFILVFCRWTNCTIHMFCKGRLYCGVGSSLIVDINAVVFMLHRWRGVCIPKHIIRGVGKVTSSMDRHWRDGIVWKVRPG